MVNSKSNSTTTKVNATSINNSNPVSAINNKAQIYEQMALEHANSAKESAEFAKSSEEKIAVLLDNENLNLVIENIDSINNASQNAEIATQQAIIATQQADRLVQGQIVYIGDDEPTDDIYGVWVETDNSDVTVDVNEVIQNQEEFKKDIQEFSNQLDGFSNQLDGFSSEITDINSSLDTKQDTLIAGDGIEIVDNVISANGGSGHDIPLGYSTYQKGIQPSVSWLKSDGQWNDGNVYTTFYNDFSQKTGQAFASGYVKNYTETYDDYDLVINQDNMTFRLPLFNGDEDIIDYGSQTKLTFTNPYTIEKTGFYYLSIDKSGANKNATITVNGKMVLNTNYSNTYSSNDITLKLTKGDVVAWQNQYSGGINYYNTIGNGNLYFKVANAVQNLELLNVGEVMEAVNNVVPNNASLICSYGIPDYTAGITIPFPTGSSWFTAPTDGIAVLYVPEIEAKVNILYINGQQTSFRVNGTQTYKDLSSLIVPLSKNSTIAFDTNSAGGSYSGTFYPYKGAI